MRARQCEIAVHFAPPSTVAVCEGGACAQKRRRTGDLREEGLRDGDLGDGGWCNFFCFLATNRSRTVSTSSEGASSSGKPISSRITLSMASVSITASFAALCFEKPYSFSRWRASSVECLGSRPERFGAKSSTAANNRSASWADWIRPALVIEAGLDSSVRIGAAFDKPLHDQKRFVGEELPPLPKLPHQDFDRILHAIPRTGLTICVSAVAHVANASAFCFSSSDRR